jgi:hypothetical protein
MAVSKFSELLEHVGHEIECVAYGLPGEDAANVALECVGCGEVLLDYDNDTD